MMNVKNVMITGVSKGIGKAIAKELVKNKNYKVYGSTRDINSVEDKIENLEYIELDLNNINSINNCIQKLNNIDILINNAGIVQISAVEETPLDKLREIFEINFFGAITLIQYFVQFMRAKQEGIIINIGSLVDKYPLPYISGYVASKSALAGYTWSLRMELKEYGIKVVLIDPTDINTSMKPELIIKEGSDYKEKIHILNQMEMENMKKAPGPEVVAKLVTKILQMNNPKPFYSIGKMATWLLLLKRVSSDRLIEKIILSHVNR